jgi:hypothetical protein
VRTLVTVSNVIEAIPPRDQWANTNGNFQVR